MDKTKTFRFSNVNGFKKKFKKIEPKIKSRKIKFELNFIEFDAILQYENDQNIYFYNDEDWFGFMRVMDIFELKIHVPTKNKSDECYIIKYKDGE